MNEDQIEKIKELMRDSQQRAKEQETEDSKLKLWSKQEILDLIAGEIGKLKTGVSFE